MDRSPGNLRQTYSFYNVIEAHISLMKEYSAHFSSEVAMKHTFFAVNVGI